MSSVSLLLLASLATSLLGRASSQEHWQWHHSQFEPSVTMRQLSNPGARNQLAQLLFALTPASVPKSTPVLPSVGLPHSRLVSVARKSDVFMDASSSPTTLSTNLSSDPAMPKGWAFPYSAEDMLQGAARAMKRAKADGVMRQIINIPVPNDERTYKVLGVVEIQGTSAEGSLDAWPGGYKQMYGSAVTCARRMLRLTNGALETSITDDLLDDFGEVGMVVAEGEKPIDDCTMVIFPNVEELEALEKVDKGVTDRRLLTLLNPTIRENARLTNGFGFFGRAGIIDRYFNRGYKPVYEVITTDILLEEAKIIGEYGVGYKVFIQLDPEDPTSMFPINEGFLPEKPDAGELLALLQKNVKSTPFSRSAVRKAKTNDWSL